MHPDCPLNCPRPEGLEVTLHGCPGPVPERCPFAARPMPPTDDAPARAPAPADPPRIVSGGAGSPIKGYRVVSDLSHYDPATGRMVVDQIMVIQHPMPAPPADPMGPGRQFELNPGEPFLSHQALSDAMPDPIPREGVVIRGGPGQSVRIFPAPEPPARPAPWLDPWLPPPLDPDDRGTLINFLLFVLAAVLFGALAWASSRVQARPCDVLNLWLGLGPVLFRGMP